MFLLFEIEVETKIALSSWRTSKDTAGRCDFSLPGESRHAQPRAQTQAKASPGVQDRTKPCRYAEPLGRVPQKLPNKGGPIGVKPKRSIYE